MDANRQDNASAAVLVAIYQAERVDSTSNMNFSLGLVAAEAAYLVGTSALWEKLALIGGWMALLPFPLICLVSFQSVLLAASATKAVSITHLERRLKKLADLSGRSSGNHLIGFVASERIFNVQGAIKNGNLALAAATLITYGGAGAIIVCYTIIVTIKSFDYLHAWGIFPAAGYLALLTVVTFSWLSGLRIVGDVLV
ncbi:hypothetical protein ABZ342_18645 [Amycolatopsis sp. NPDC005961]|uniref:hypothetical protein n=1 Tax=Amycolatopsis sp. NPDC005961 TaxID=3156720 RepID=UPI0033C9B9C0